jgi:hypothetical protein
MALPNGCHAPTTPLQQALCDLGFYYWWDFHSSSFPQRSGFYAAFATGLLCHVWPSYPEFLKLHTVGNWHMKAATLKAIDARYGDLYGEEKFTKPEYWVELSDECANCCSAIFLAEFKEEVTEMVRSKRVKDTSDESFYEKIASHFQAYLRIYEMTDDGPRVKDFCGYHKGDFATYVNIAFEGDSVLVLSHKDFEWTSLPKARFPNYTVIKVPGSEPPQFNSSPVQPRPVDTSLLVPTMGKMISLLSGFAVSLKDNPAEAKNIQDSIRGTLQDLEELGRDKEDLTPHFSSVQNVLAMPIEIQVHARPREPHTIVNCDEYPELGPIEEHHHHRFHKDCLLRHLNSISGDFSIGLICPIPNCSTPLAENVVDTFPHIKEKFVTWKMQTLVMHSVTGPTEPKQPCNRCREEDYLAFLTCGCKLCRRCSSNSYWNGKCANCQRATGEQDQRVISYLFERFPSTV